MTEHVKEADSHADQAVRDAAEAYCATQPLGTKVRYEDMRVALDAALPHLMAAHENDAVETFESRFYEPDQT